MSWVVIDAATRYVIRLVNTASTVAGDVGEGELSYMIADSVWPTPPFDGAILQLAVDNTTLVWADLRTLQEAKDARWSELLIERAAREFSTFTWDGSVFDCDAESQTRIIGSATLAIIASMTAQPFSIDWTLADDTVRTLSGPDMLNVGAALGAHVTAVHETSRALYDQIEAATTNAQVDAVVWP